MEMTPLSKTIRFAQPLAGAALVETTEAVEIAGQINVLGDTLQMMPHELEAIKEQAYRAGEQAGEEKATDIYRQELAEEIAICGKMASELMALKQDLVNELHTALAELVLEAVGRLMFGWQPDAAEVKAMVESLLDDFDPADHQMRVRLHPETLELLRSTSLEAFTENNRQLEFIADAKLQRGECMLEGRFGLADARYSEKLKNLNEVLTDE
jgi:flagellar biosynthesis/type III secretory pathway protein FliH